jgi:hypothetical protein
MNYAPIHFPRFKKETKFSKQTSLFFLQDKLKTLISELTFRVSTETELACITFIFGEEMEAVKENKNKGIALECAAKAY